MSEGIQLVMPFFAFQLPSIVIRGAVSTVEELALLNDMRIRGILVAWPVVE